MRNIEILSQQPKEVLDKLKLGEIDSIEYGYKLGSLRSLLDDGGIITSIPCAAI